MRFINKACICSIFVFCCMAAISLEAAVDPVVIELHYQNGVKYYKRGLYKKAIAEFEKVLTLDPVNKDAQDFRDKVMDFSEKKQLVDSRSNRDEAINKLYSEGKMRYSNRDYLGAIEIFDKVLEIKPIDDVASDYKERCEKLIVRDFTKNKKVEDKKRQAQRREEERLARKEDKEAKKFAHQKMLEDRAKITEERHSEKREKIKIKARVSEVEEKITAKSQAKEEDAGVVVNKAAVKKQKAKEEKEARIQEKKQKKEEALDKRQALREEALEKKQEKIQSDKERKANKLFVKKEQAQETKDAKEVLEVETKNAKALYLEGVKNFGKQQFQAAVDSFDAAIDSESRSKKKQYTSSAQRFKERAQKRLEIK